MITAKALTTLFPRSRVVDFLPVFEANFEQYGLTNKNRIAWFLATAGHECQGFTVFTENLNYKADQLAKTWKERYSLFRMEKGKKVYTLQPNALALEIQRKPVVIANKTYANRMGNGNEASGDGWKYRGRGIFMNTGKDQYRIIDRRLNLDGAMVADPDMLLLPEYAGMGAFYFWSDRRLNTFADANDNVGLRKAVNGGKIGLKETTELYVDIYKQLSA